MVRTAIIGFGNRGSQYADILMRSGRAEIIAAVDPNERARALANRRFGISEERLYECCEDFFAGGKPDAAVIASDDRFHFEQASKALRAGCHVLIEKPVSARPEECLELIRLAEQCRRTVTVCHVLRYNLFYREIKRLLEAGVIGKTVSIRLNEDVAYWRAAHGYVRGDWAKTSQSGPMILTKSCHDLDLLSAFTESNCVSVSSFGDLSLFNPENAPGKAEFCGECPSPVREKCPFDAYKIYSRHPEYLEGNRFGVPGAKGKPEDNSGLYRCVFRCGNDAVDHQAVNMLFENGVTAQFSMDSLAARDNRRITIHGSEGELSGDLAQAKITLCRFGCPPEEIDLKVRSDEAGCHGGGDEMLVRDFLDSVEGAPNAGGMRAGLKEVIQSHFIAFAAEQSRLSGGSVVKIREII